MLKQLLKYEFKATGRTYGGLYLALVALAVLSGFSLRSSSKDNFASLLLFAYMVVAVAVAVVSSILCIYAACMIGHQFKKHMVPAGILAFFLLSFLQNWLSSGVSSADMLQAVSDPTLGGVDVSIAAPSAFTTLFGLAVSIAFAAGYFLLTRWLMEHKLDLE